MLRHQTPHGTHFDLMIEAGPPADQDRDDAPTLWTVRIDLPPRDWAAHGAVRLTLLPPHRRAYLYRQGPVSGGRGRVTRVDAGTAVIHQTHDHGFQARLALGTFTGTIHAHATAPGHGLARFRAKNV